MREAYSESADVFSLAMILFELITHTVPFSDRSALQAAVSIGLQRLRPAMPDGTPDAARDHPRSSETPRDPPRLDAGRHSRRGARERACARLPLETRPPGGAPTGEAAHRGVLGGRRPRAPEGVARRGARRLHRARADSGAAPVARLPGRPPATGRRTGRPLPPRRGAAPQTAGAGGSRRGGRRAGGGRELGAGSESPELR